MPDFEDLEKLVAKIQQELAPTSKVLHDQKLIGRKSGRSRQIDVLVVDNVGQYEIRIVIDCKDYRKPVDVKSVEEFSGLLDDVGAHKGVLVCPSGFSKSAKTRAEGLQIALYSPVDTDPHKWRVDPQIPVCCDFRTAAISFGFSTRGPYPFHLPNDFYLSSQVTNPEGDGLGTMFEIACHKWNNGELPIEAGRHDNLEIFGEVPHMDNGLGMTIPIRLYVGLTVRKYLFFGHLPITKISGFKDEIAGGVITNAFEVGLLDPNHIWDKWKKIETVEKCDVPPVMELRGLIGWDENHPDRLSISPHA